MCACGSGCPHFPPRGEEYMHAVCGPRLPRGAQRLRNSDHRRLLGKIEVVGPDAAEVMNRFYLNNCPIWPSRPLALRDIVLREDGFHL